MSRRIYIFAPMKPQQMMPQIGLWPTAGLRLAKAAVLVVLAAVAILLLMGCGGVGSRASDRQALAALVADMNGQLPMPMEGMTLERMTMESEGIVYEYRLEADGAALLRTLRAERAEVEAMLMDGLLRAPDARAMVQLSVRCDLGVGYRYVELSGPDTALFLLPAARLAAALERTK